MSGAGDNGSYANNEGSGGGNMVVEQVEGNGYFTPPDGSKSKLEVGAEIPMDSFVDFRGDYFV